MAYVKTTIGRRSFIKSSLLAGGGMLLGFNWMAACTSNSRKVLKMSEEWFRINAFLKLGVNGVATIMSPNPEIGQNVKTSMPMIVAEELDIDWDNVIVEQARLNTDLFTRQIAGGSQSIRQGWNGLRLAGATARRMLMEAAAQAWNVPVDEISTDKGFLYHKSSNKKAGYGEMASAAAIIKVPETVQLKEVKDFKIIGTSRKNVDGPNIVKGVPLFGIDYSKEGMFIAMITHPPAFGLKLKSVDDSSARSMPGIKDIFTINTYLDDYQKGSFDTSAFNELVVVVGDSTWEVMNAKDALKIEWEPITGSEKIPSRLENTGDYNALMKEMGSKPGNVRRKDGNPEAAFQKASKVIERTYTAPFLAHNTMEPMNFFANVTEDKAELAGPVQTPEFMEKSVAARLGMPLEKIDIEMTRMGGGFGRRLYGHFLVEAAVISQRIKAPVKLIYKREDDMTFGSYRPAYHVYYRAGLDADNKLIAFHVRAGGMSGSSLSANRFPAGAVDNYLAEEWSINTNITTGAFRAPGSNFMASAEQSFLDEVAEAAGKDPIEFRLELFNRTKTNPVGTRNDYDASRYAGVLELVREKSGWGTQHTDMHRGVAAYFCHNSYVANVLDVTLENGKPVIQKVYAAIDCGIVINPDSATNLAEGGIVDGIGHSMYSELTFNNGKPEQKNFDEYRLIRHREAPKSIEIHFVKNEIDPTGLGEPPFPPVIGALANALYKATGKRHYHQPFIQSL